MDEVAMDVVHLTEKTFDLYVTDFDNQGILVLFHVNTCNDCKIIKPKVELASTKLKEKGIEGKIAMVDCSEEIKLANKLGIECYPALRYYRGKRNENKVVRCYDLGPNGMGLSEPQDIVNFISSTEEEDARYLEEYKKHMEGCGGIVMDKKKIAEQDPELAAHMKLMNNMIQEERIKNLYKRPERESKGDQRLSVKQKVTKDQLGMVKPMFIPDHWTPNCINCDSKFTFLRRRHHCRACGQVFCSNCCSEKYPLMYMRGEPARVCKPCKSVLEEQRKT